MTGPINFRASAHIGRAASTRYTEAITVRHFEFRLPRHAIPQTSTREQFQTRRMADVFDSMRRISSGLAECAKRGA